MHESIRHCCLGSLLKDQGGPRAGLWSLRDCRLLFASLLAILALLTALHGQAVPSARADVIRELQQGDNQAALSLAQQALKQQPHDCSLLTLQAVALTGLHQADSALHSFRTALASCPDFLAALEGAAQIEFARKNPEAGSLLDRIVAIQPGNIVANAMLATLLRQHGRCPDALSRFEASRSLFPSRPDLQQGFGSCLAETGDLHGALEVYDQLLLSRPNDTIRYDVALLQWKTHASEDALKTLSPLLEGQHVVPALALASKIHEETGETPEAVTLLRAAIVQSPQVIENYLDFATIALAHNSFQVGIDVLNAGLQQLPAAAPLLIARGVLEVQLSQSQAAFADFERAHQIDPKLSLAADAIGILHSQQHQSAESLATFATLAQQHGDDPLLQYLLAEQLSEGRADTTLPAAIVAARRAVDLDPRYKAAHDLLAVLYVRANRPQEAIQQAEAALALDPNDQNALYQEMMARRRMGDTAQIRAVTARFNEARKQNERKQQRVDRYSLQEE